MRIVLALLAAAAVLVGAAGAAVTVALATRELDRLDAVDHLALD
jgi:hypothetical protein